MAGRFGTATADTVATGTSAKTILQIIAAANQGVWLNRIGVSFNGTTNTNAPVKITVARQTTAGTGTTAADVEKRDDSVSESLQTTANKGASTEPTTTDVLSTFRVHPQTGYERMMDGDHRIYIPPGDRVGIIALAANDVGCSVEVDFEE